MNAIHEKSCSSECADSNEVPLTPKAASVSRHFVVWGGGLLVAVLVPLFVLLGNWQWQKAELKSSWQALRDARANEAPVVMTSALVDAEALRYRQVVVRGYFDTQHEILIDNLVHHDHVGFHVVTPLIIKGSDASNPIRVLVDRGWIPAGDSRAVLPTVETPADELELNATAVMPGTRFFTLGQQPTSINWSNANERIWPNLDLARYRQMVDFPLQPVILQLAPSSPAGFVREWPQPSERIERHLGYAWQWYGFALSAVMIWGFFLIQPWLQRYRLGRAK